jgi:GntR family transcriptional regulator
VNNRDPRPIYEQISEGFKRLIISGVLAADDKLPSVRELAGQLAINPNTIQRAYRELETAGYCYSVPGRGSFVAADRQQDRARIDALTKQLQETARELLFLGLEREEIQQCLWQKGEQS